MIYLQISTAQGPAECRIFARFVLKKLLAEAEARNVKAEIAGETADKHGILSAVLMLEGAAADTLRARCNGCAPAPSVRNIRVKTGISAYSACRKNPKCRLKAKSSSKPAVQAAKVGSTSIKQSRPSAPHTKPAVFPCGWKGNAASMPTKNARWNFWHTNWPNIKPHKMPTMPNSSTAVCIR